MRQTPTFIGLDRRAGRPAVALALALAAAACGGGGKGSGPEPEPLAVSVQVQGTEQAHLLGGGTATLTLRGPIQLDLVTSAATTWTVVAGGGPVTVTEASGSTSTHYVAVLGVPAGGSGTVTLSGDSQSALGQPEVSITLTDGRTTGAYYTGEYPDLFVDVLGKTEEEVQTRIDDAFAQLFSTTPPASSDDAQLYVENGDEAYIQNYWSNGGVEALDIRSEGMSYGMMIAVQLDRKDVFDKLWKFSKNHMQHASGARQGYFAWQVNPDLTTTKTDTRPYDENPAPDGEEWYVTGLFMASHRWGDGQGIYDYRAEAQAILDTALHKEEQAGHGQITNMFNGEHLVVFQPKDDGNADTGARFTDPSYHLPGFYELWARWADKDQAFWCAAASASRALIDDAANDATGLSPDYSSFSGTPFQPSWITRTRWQDDHRNSMADAQRVGANIGVDQLWFRRGGTDAQVAEALLAFLRNDDYTYTPQGSSTSVTIPGLASDGTAIYCNSHSVDGTCLSARTSSAYSPASGFKALNAAAVHATATSGDNADFLESLWVAPVPTGRNAYYNKMIYLLGLLQASGHFRVYHPATGPVVGCD